MTTSLSVFFGKDKSQVFFFSGDQYIRFNKSAAIEMCQRACAQQAFAVATSAATVPAAEEAREPVRV